MLRPITALLWEMSRRRRGNVFVLAALMLFALVFKFSLPDRFLQTETGLDLFHHISALLMVASVACVFAIFNFTESSPEKEWTGFPYRLFVLPLPTFLLVALPLIALVFRLAFKGAPRLSLVLPSRPAFRRFVVLHRPPALRRRPPDQLVPARI
jgi:hypothetical protein